MIFFDCVVLVTADDRHGFIDPSFRTERTIHERILWFWYKLQIAVERTWKTTAQNLKGRKHGMEFPYFITAGVLMAEERPLHTSGQRIQILELREWM